MLAEGDSLDNNLADITTPELLYFGHDVINVFWHDFIPFWQSSEQELTYLRLDKMVTIPQTTFSNSFCRRKILHFDANFTEVFFFKEVSFVITSICSGNALAPNRRQAITWTNVNPVHWGIYTALGDTFALFQQWLSKAVLKLDFVWEMTFAYKRVVTICFALYHCCKYVATFTNFILI